MDAGRLDKRLTFEAPAPIEDGAGNTVSGFATQFTTAASVIPMRGGESVFAARLEATQPGIVTIRSSAQARLIDAGWRAVDQRAGNDQHGKPRAVYQVKETPRHPVDKMGHENRAFLEFMVMRGVVA